MRRQTRMSLRSRMTLIAVAVVALVVTLGGAVVVVAVRGELIEAADDMAEARAEEIAGLAARGVLPPTLPSTDEVDAAVQVVRGGKVVLATRGVPVEPFDLPPQQPGMEQAFGRRALLPDHDGPFRIVARGTPTPKGDATVFVALEVKDVEDVIAALLQTGALVLAVLVAAVSAVFWVVIGRTLKPIEAIRRRAEVITGSRLQQRVPEPVTQDEVGRLARTINAMLARLEASAKRQERFVADAAHELRSPLAALRARLETALAGSPAAWDADLLPDLLDQTVRMSSLVEQLLLLARKDAGMLAVAADQPVDLDDLICDVVSAQRVGPVEVHAQAVQPVQALGEPALLELVVRNLLDNAVRHARSRVEISLAAAGNVAVLTVDDDGSGIPAQARAGVLQRFVRLDDSRERRRGGAGLGLAIVSDVVGLHGGSVEVADSPTGGARLVVSLPLDRGLERVTAGGAQVPSSPARGTASRLDANVGHPARSVRR